jgi:hypothetical protein
MYTYEKVETLINDKPFAYIKATSLDDVNVWLNIPIDEANSDYQAYLKRDEAKTI